MRITDEVAFGGSGLNRAAELREDATQIAALLAGGQVLPIWRGKPLIVAGEALGWLASDSPVLAGAGTPVFLGLDDGVARFAADISAWSPKPGPRRCEAGFFDPSEQRHPALPDNHAFVELRGVMTRLTPREAELVATAKAVLQWHRSHGFCAACGAASDHGQGGLAADLPGLRRAAFSAHRSGGDHAGDAWQPPAAGPLARLARRDVFAAGRVSSNPAKRSKPPCAARCWRKPASGSGRCAIWPASPGPFRPR